MSDSSEDESDAAQDAYPRKRRKQTKEDRMLGIFGSDSEEENELDGKVLHRKSVSFQRAGLTGSDDEDERHDPDLEFRTAFVQEDEVAQHTDRSLEHPAHKSDETTSASAAIQPLFGFFSDSSHAFIPKANPAQSRLSSLDSGSLSSRKSYQPQMVGTGQRPPTSKKPMAGASSKLQSGKAARMMAMMGYKAGEGLGLNQKGIVTPIEAQLRTEQKAGLGSETAPIEDKKPKKSSKTRTQGLDDDPTIQRAPSRAPKLVYRTGREIELEAGGDFALPKALESIIDMTGSQPKSIAASEMSSSATRPNRDEAYRISQRARAEAQSYAIEWRTLQDRKSYVHAEKLRQDKDLHAIVQQFEALQVLNREVTEISSIPEHSHDDMTTLSQTLSRCEMLVKAEIKAATGQINLAEVIVILNKPILQPVMASWSVLEEPRIFLEEMRKLRELSISASLPTSVNDITPGRVTSTSMQANDLGEGAATSFDALMATLWYNRVRDVLIGTWNDGADQKILTLLTAWAPLTPMYLQHQLNEQFILPHIQSRIRSWQPLHCADRNALSWLFPWLPYIHEFTTEVVLAVKRRFSMSLASWTPSTGLIKYLDNMKDILGTAELDALLSEQVLPKLAEELRSRLVIDPSSQKLDALNNVLQWRHQFPTRTLAVLLEAEFFPKWTKLLHAWLNDNPDYEEISQWYEWWQEVIPKSLLRSSLVQRCFAKGLRMMDTALEHGPQALDPLPIGPSKPVDHKNHVREKTAKARVENKADAYQAEVTFKDVLEAWCADRNYLMIPLRKAHHSGNAMYRITASSSGSGGIIIYLRGDVIMKLNKDKDTWSAAGLEDISSAIA